ncbi:MAG TPA: guanylate kinase [Dehalococcoidia bacterium]|nr:guanylate kinase [Dehalococcoidia bacterium]
MAEVPLLVILTGPSGAGKDTLVARLRERTGANFGFAVTATSRPPRHGEQDGRDYHFVSRREFERMVEDGELLEHAVVYGQLKGVPRKSVRTVLDAGQDVILRTDIQGAHTLKELIPDAVTIFVTPPTREEMARRLRERDSDTDEQIAKRLETATEEMRSAENFDYVITNDDLDRAAAEIEAIVAEERARADRGPLELA